MKLILDMNISPKLVDILCQSGIDARHWYMIGKPDAKDSEIMAYAKEHGCAIVTSDLDFTAILSNTKGGKPSVIQIRKHGLQLDLLADLLAAVVSQWADELENGAILSVDPKNIRLRLLPLN